MSDETMRDAVKANATRRTFLKAGAAAGAAFGLTRVDAVVPDQFGMAAAQEDSASALVYSPQFLPEASFELLLEIDDAEELLTVGADDDEQTPGGVPNPDEWDAFAIQYTFSDVPYHAFAFFEQAVEVQEGDEFTLNQDATFFDASVNILETTVGGEGDDEDEAETPEEDDAEDEDETETPEEEGAETETPTETPTETGNETENGTPTVVTPAETVTGNESG